MGETTDMKKHGTKRPAMDPSISVLSRASGRQTSLRVVLDARIALREFLVAAEMKALFDELEADRTMLCRPKGKLLDDRQAYRHAHERVGDLKPLRDDPRARAPAEAE